MSDDRDAGTARVRERIDRLRRAGAGPAGSPFRAAPDAPAAVAACIRTDNRAAARDLADAWLRAAGRAVTGSGASRRDRDALALLARVLGVPTAYFTDEASSRSVDESFAVAAEASRRGVTSHGPCRGAPPGSRLAAVHTRVVRELERDGERTPG